MQLSVIICTHNPRESYLKRVLAALATQTLPLDQWELLVIDNASAAPVAEKHDIGWHPDGRHLVEREIGLTKARLRGISEAKADTLIFCDDDNLLSSDFLAKALETGRGFPFLGAWGGSVRGEFETVPPKWAIPSLGLIAIFERDKPTWSNEIRCVESHPCGAGLCVRRSVAERYASDASESPIKLALDRKGQALLSGGDMDLIFTSSKLGLGWGTFPDLLVTHLIPSGRLTHEYFLRICAGSSQSWNMLLVAQGLKPEVPPGFIKQLVKAAYILLRQGLFASRMYLTSQRARKVAIDQWVTREGV